MKVPVMIARLYDLKYSGDEIHEGLQLAEEGSTLLSSVRQHGVIRPIMITEDGWIINGRRRYLAARVCQIKNVPVQVHSPKTMIPLTSIRQWQVGDRIRFGGSVGVVTKVEDRTITVKYDDRDNEERVEAFWPEPE